MDNTKIVNTFAPEFSKKRLKYEKDNPFRTYGSSAGLYGMQRG